MNNQTGFSRQRPLNQWPTDKPKAFDERLDAFVLPVITKKNGGVMSMVANESRNSTEALQARKNNADCRIKEYNERMKR